MLMRNSFCICVCKLIRHLAGGSLEISLHPLCW